jgi:hypothetical protein
MYANLGVMQGKHAAGATLPKECTDGNKQCTGCYISGDQPWLSPCDDDPVQSHGAQTLSLNLGQIPRAWLLDGHGGGDDDGGGGGDVLMCDVFDIFATPNKGKSLGQLTSFSAVVPPHGVRFLRLSNCK